MTAGVHGFVYFGMSHQNVTVANKFFFLFAFVAFVITGCARRGYRDQEEYGYQGKIKTIIKNVYPDAVISGENVLPNDSSSSFTHTYHFNEMGNIDSTSIVLNLASGSSIYKTVYQFNDGKKASWTTVGASNERVAYGKITWATDKEYTEEAFYDNGLKQSITKTTLNSSFRVIKTEIKAFDDSARQIQNDVVEPTYNAAQKIQSYKTTHLADKSVVTSYYKYLESDPAGNPLRLVITDQGRERPMLMTMQYSYYQ